MVAGRYIIVDHAFFAETLLCALTGGKGFVFFGGKGHAAHDIGFASAHFNGVGGDDGAGIGGMVGNHHHVFVESFFQLEGAEIHPHAACHGLIHGVGFGVA